MDVIWDEAYEMVLLSNDAETKNTFVPAGEPKKNGWCWMRLVRIERRRALGAEGPFDAELTLYNPAIHDNTNHYMGHLWRARRYYNVSYHEYRYTLLNPFGGHMDVPLRRVYTNEGGGEK